MVVLWEWVFLVSEVPLYQIEAVGEDEEREERVRMEARGPRQERTTSKVVNIDT